MIEDEREKTYIEAMKARGNYDPELLYIGRFTSEDGLNLMKQTSRCLMISAYCRAHHKGKLQVKYGG